MKKTRTNKRSRSGATTPCPHCGKLLRGGKGVKAHAFEAHGVVIELSQVVWKGRPPSQATGG